jgi:hypothetical protein
MERRKQNWGTLVYTLKAGTRRNPLFRSSPNLSSPSSRTQFDDWEQSGNDDDDYGFITKPPPPIPNPPIPPIPLEFQDEYQKRLKEHQNKVYWESIKRQLSDYYNHHHHQQSQRFERMSGFRGSSGVINNLPMETASVSTKANSTNKLQKNKQNSAAQSVPVQSSFGLDDDWISGRNRRDSGSTSELLDQVCEVQDCCERFEDFRDEEGLRASEKLTPLCVKCLVRYYNSRPTKREGGTMSRVSSTLV